VENNEIETRELEELERKLRMALARREAPLGLKQRVLAQARQRRLQGQAPQQSRGWMLQRIAASILLAALFGGFAVYRQQEERRKGEAAREQVMTALRITNRTLDRVSQRLAVESK
jgi:hypothetical protein